MKLSTSDTLKLAAIVAVAVAAFVVARKAIGLAGEGVELVGRGLQAINPANPENIIAEAVNDAGGWIADDPEWNLGGWLYDVTHADPMALPADPVLAEDGRTDPLGNTY